MFDVEAPVVGDGSSPRVRGTPGDGDRGPRRARFIPACAGNAPLDERVHDAAPVHPRVCGERSPSLPSVCPGTGSSPRVRGTRGRAERSRTRQRFIPACAGNARWSADGSAARSVHPRVCGERAIAHDATAWSPGSSPRVRGTPGVGVVRRARRRFIPACAGNARTRASIRPTSSVHPRVCGERSHGLYALSRADGSSPRVRGTLLRVLPRRRGLRFIPACAGNAPSGRSRRCVSPVHPRVCGERFSPATSGRIVGGSSPRVRGTQPRDQPDSAGRRFIPACAGNA